MAPGTVTLLKLNDMLRMMAWTNILSMPFFGFTQYVSRETYHVNISEKHISRWISAIRSLDKKKSILMI